MSYLNKMFFVKCVGSSGIIVSFVNSVTIVFVLSIVSSDSRVFDI